MSDEAPATLNSLLDDPEALGEVIQSMSHVSFLEQLDKFQLEVLARGGDLRHFETKQTVFKQGDHDDGLHLVLDGAVQLLAVAADGTGQLVATQQKGNSFGEIAFMTGAPRNLTAIAGPAGALSLILSRRQFDEIARRNDAIGHKVFRHLLELIQSRMEALPPYMRNYLLWGYRPGGSTFKTFDQSAMVDLNTFRFWITGGVSTLLGYLIYQDVFPAAISSRPGLGMLLLLIVGAVLGGIVAETFRYVEEEVRSRMRHPRSCGNCNFSFWDESKDRVNCLYIREGLKDVKIKMSREFDTYTPCPSFEASGKNVRARTGQRSASEW